MTLSNFMAGFRFLEPYTDAWTVPLGSEYDSVYVYPTNRPLPPEVITVLRSLRWFQPNVENDDEGNPGPYNPKKGWVAYV